jgi:hypothetical protein
VKETKNNLYDKMGIKNDSDTDSSEDGPAVIKPPA